MRHNLGHSTLETNCVCQYFEKLVSYLYFHIHKKLPNELYIDYLHNLICSFVTLGPCSMSKVM